MMVFGVVGIQINKNFIQNKFLFLIIFLLLFSFITFRYSRYGNELDFEPSLYSKLPSLYLDSEIWYY